MAKDIIVFTTSEDFRYRLVLATLSSRAIRIKSIRSDDMDPGLRDYEVSFLRLLQAVTNGSYLKVEYTGTEIFYRPGIITGPVEGYVHDCPLSRGMGYYIEPLLMLGPFCTRELRITFKGISSSSKDLGVDTIRTAFFPVLEKFGASIEPRLECVSRGSEPNGGGEYILTMRSIKQPITLHALDTPQVEKIGGIAYATKMSPDSINRMIDTARTILRPTAVDTRIFSDHVNRHEAGKSPGFGMVLVAETRTGFPICAEGVGAAGTTPEDLATRVAAALIQQINVGGTVQRSMLPMVMIMMLLGKEDLGRIVIGRDTVDVGLVRLLRAVKQLFNVEILLREHSDTELMCTVRGTGFVNTARAAQ